MSFIEVIKEKCREHEKVKLFVDMDGTIAEYPVLKTNEAEKKMTELYGSTKPLMPVIEVLGEISKIPNLEMYILSLSKNDEITAKKEVWLKKYVPFIKESNHLILTRGKGYTDETRDIAKPENIVKHKEPGCYLIMLDDDHKVLRIAQKMVEDSGEVYHASSAIA